MSEDPMVPPRNFKSSLQAPSRPQQCLLIHSYWVENRGADILANLGAEQDDFQTILNFPLLINVPGFVFVSKEPNRYKITHISIS
jgi:hypothetical protein